MVEITEIAVKRIKVLIKEQAERHQKHILGLRVTTKGAIPNAEYALAFVEIGKEEPDDVPLENEEVKVFAQEKNKDFLSDVKIDFIQTLQESGFKVENPKVVALEASAPTGPKTPADLTTPQAIAIQKVLDVEINPGIASHGGIITLIDVKDNVVYVQMGGGCQGCGMAKVTLSQGVVTAIKKSVPEITEVMDITDHAGGNNPYYSPGK